MHLVKVNDSDFDASPKTVEELQIYLDNFTQEYLKNYNVNEHYQFSESSMHA